MSASEEWERTGLQTKSGAEKTFVRLKASYPHVEMYIDEDKRAGRPKMPEGKGTKMLRKHDIERDVLEHAYGDAHRLGCPGSYHQALEDLIAYGPTEDAVHEGVREAVADCDRDIALADRLQYVIGVSDETYYAFTSRPIEDQLKAMEANSGRDHVIGWELGYHRGYQDAREGLPKRNFPWNFEKEKK